MWSNRPLLAFLDAWSATSSCLTIGKLKDWKAFHSNNVCCERQIVLLKNQFYFSLTRIKIPKIDDLANILKSKVFRLIVPFEVVYKLGYSDSFDTNCSSIRQLYSKIEQYLNLGLRRHRNGECGQLKCKIWLKKVLSLM